MFSTSERSKPGMSSQKKSYMPSLSTHLKTNWMKRGSVILREFAKFYEQG